MKHHHYEHEKTFFEMWGEQSLFKGMLGAGALWCALYFNYYLQKWSSGSVGIFHMWYTLLTLGNLFLGIGGLALLLQNIFKLFWMVVLVATAFWVSR